MPFNIKKVKDISFPKFSCLDIFVKQAQMSDIVSRLILKFPVLQNYSDNLNVLVQKVFGLKQPLHSFSSYLSGKPSQTLTKVDCGQLLEKEFGGSFFKYFPDSDPKDKTPIDFVLFSKSEIDGIVSEISTIIFSMTEAMEEFLENLQNIRGFNSNAFSRAFWKALNIELDDLEMLDENVQYLIKNKFLYNIDGFPSRQDIVLTINEIQKSFETNQVKELGAPDYVVPEATELQTREKYELSKEKINNHPFKIINGLLNGDIAQKEQLLKEYSLSLNDIFQNMSDIVDPNWIVKANPEEQKKVIKQFIEKSLNLNYKTEEKFPKGLRSAVDYFKKKTNIKTQIDDGFYQFDLFYRIIETNKPVETEEEDYKLWVNKEKPDIRSKRYKKLKPGLQRTFRLDEDLQKAPKQQNLSDISKDYRFERLLNDLQEEKNEINTNGFDYIRKDIFQNEEALKKLVVSMKKKELSNAVNLTNNKLVKEFYSEALNSSDMIESNLLTGTPIDLDDVRKLLVYSSRINQALSNIIPGFSDNLEILKSIGNKDVWFSFILCLGNIMDGFDKVFNEVRQTIKRTISADEDKMLFRELFSQLMKVKETYNRIINQGAVKLAVQTNLVKIAAKMDYSEAMKIFGLKNLFYDLESIKKIRNNLIRSNHPDLNPNDPIKLERAKQINVAYHVLKQKFNEQDEAKPVKPEFKKPDKNTLSNFIRNFVYSTSELFENLENLLRGHGMTKALEFDLIDEKSVISSNIMPLVANLKKDIFILKNFANNFSNFFIKLAKKRKING